MATTSTETREVRATAKYVRVSPGKARLVIDLIRGKNVAQAFDILHFCTRSVAVDVEKVLRSAVANAEHNNQMRADDLVVKAAYVDEGPTLKRMSTTTRCAPTTWSSRPLMSTRARRSSASVLAPRAPLPAS